MAAPRKANKKARYTVLLVYPGFDEGRENAEALLQESINWLNRNKDEPGMRFAPEVTAKLEAVDSAEEAQERLRADASVAALVVHGSHASEEAALIRECNRRGIGIAFEAEGAEMPRGMALGGTPHLSLVSGKKEQKTPSVSTYRPGELTDPPTGVEGGDDERLATFIGILALGVMQYHDRQLRGGTDNRQNPV